MVSSYRISAGYAIPIPYKMQGRGSIFLGICEKVLDICYLHRYNKRVLFEPPV